MLESFPIGKTGRTDVSVYNAFGLMSSGLVKCTLIIINAGHCFLLTFFEFCVFRAG